MNILKKFLSNINIIAQCKSSRLSIWQCPSFLFILMGVINIGAMLGTYSVASRYNNEPEVVAFIVVAISLILFIIGSLIVENFNKIVEANRLKSEFVSIVSHQLRSPLSSIRWTLDLILGKRIGKMDPKIEEYLISAKSSTKRMIVLVNDILSIRHIEEGRFGENKKSVRLEDIVKQVFSDLKSFALASNVELTLEMPPNNSMPVKADPKELSLVIQNLVENGVKYIKGKGLVKIRLANLRDSVKVAVEDNGVGIPEADKKYIFQRFFRASNARVIQTEGTGLGLYIVKAIIENLGGTTGFKSEEDKGSIFWFTLPIKK